MAHMNCAECLAGEENRLSQWTVSCRRDLERLTCVCSYPALSCSLVGRNAFVPQYSATPSANSRCAQALLSSKPPAAGDAWHAVGTVVTQPVGQRPCLTLSEGHAIQNQLTQCHCAYCSLTQQYVIN